MTLSRPWKIFLVVWIVYSVHFTTNVVREHYPAFSVAAHGSWRVDEYQGFHPDIFTHTDGHSYINNQVLVSTLAALPLAAVTPILDALEDYSRSRRTVESSSAEYRTDKPLRQAFFRLVSERGLALRFGAATLVTAVWFMAPLTALFLVWFYRLLRRRGVDVNAATGLTLLLAFGTPLFYRASTLNHNMFVMFGMFGSFALLAGAAGSPVVSASRRFWAGLLAGVTIAVDYIGLVTLPLMFAYFVVTRRAATSWTSAAREAVPMLFGAIPPLLFLVGSQWAMFGHPFYPAQYWMPANQNAYTAEGVRGFGWPAPDLLLENLVHPGYGLLLWVPLVLLAVVPPRRDGGRAVMPTHERRFLWVASAALLIFCSMNQYARLQWNSGFRYLLPLVPLIVLALADRWIRLPRSARLSVAGLVVLHSWVLTVFREPVGRSWALFLSEGPQLPWLRVLRMTSSPESRWLNSWWLPVLILAITLVVVGLIWLRRERHEAGLAEAQGR